MYDDLFNTLNDAFIYVQNEFSPHCNWRGKSNERSFARYLFNAPSGSLTFDDIDDAFSDYLESIGENPSDYI